MNRQVFKLQSICNLIETFMSS